MLNRLRKPSPALFVSTLALFLALGGSAFALGSKLAPQPRCATGAIRGIAVVTGGPNGIANLPSTYTSSPAVFGYRWNCTGRSIAVKTSSASPGVDIRFDGNPASVAVISSFALTIGGGSVIRSPDGSFHVTMGDANGQFESTRQFVIVLV
jgi:hypothetical protein